MKRSDNLRLVFTVAHISKGLKSPLPKKGTVQTRLQIKLIRFICSDRPTDIRQSTTLFPRAYGLWPNWPR